MPEPTTDTVNEWSDDSHNPYAPFTVSVSKAVMDDWTSADVGDHDSLSRARRWTLHVKADDTEHLNSLVRRVRNLGSHYGTVLGYFGGDSWDEWYGNPEDGAPLVLHVVFTAYKLTHAQERAVAIATALGRTTPEAAVLSTWGDWAEGAEIFPSNRKTTDEILSFTKNERVV